MQAPATRTSQTTGLLQRGAWLSRPPPRTPSIQDAWGRLQWGSAAPHFSSSSEQGPGEAGGCFSPSSGKDCCV